MISTILNTISVGAAFLLAVGVIFILLNVTIGKHIKVRSKYEWHGLQIKDFVFITVGALIVLKFMRFVLPY